MPSATTSGWNYADVWEAVADQFPKALALAHGPHEVDWETFDARADSIALALLAAGIPHQGKVAQYLRNRPEYLESLFATFKAGHVPVNTNYRYGDDELRYLWTNSDTAAVIFDAEFTVVCERLRSSLPSVRLWLRVGGNGDDPDWAVPYEEAAATRPGRVVAPWGRSGDDLYLLYTGGTTGMPKGVMWPQDELFRMLESGRTELAGEPADATAWVARLERLDPAVLPAPPLMHGTGCWFCLPVLSRGGTVVTLTSPSLDAIELLDTVVAREVRRLCIVGDAFAKPILRELEAHPDRWDLSKLRVILSSGAILSQDSKSRLLQVAPKAQVFDGLGSSESGNLAMSVTTTDTTAANTTFALSPKTRVLDDDGQDVVPGSDQVGRLAIGGHLPLGYYGDREKTAATFVQLDGGRYVISGDWAQVDSDGRITLLGRGSSCINTAGEKVYPEEVEEVLKQAVGVSDAAVVGVPDDRFGQRVVALIEPEGVDVVDEQALIDHVKASLAAYKAPRRVLVLRSLDRGPNGKLDHQRLREIAIRGTST